jgi:hypothetical protein
MQFRAKEVYDEKNLVTRCPFKPTLSVYALFRTLPSATPVEV